MLDTVIIMGVVMAITEVIKPHIPKKLIFVPVIGLSAILCAANAYFFGDALVIKEAISEGIRLGAMTSGVYGLGKAALGLDKDE